MGKPFRPPQLKLLSGTARKCRAREIIPLPLVEAPPAPPDWLTNPHALAEWSRLVQILMANKLLTTVGLLPLAHLCATHGAIVDEYEAGGVPTSAACSMLRGFCNDFGMTPVAQMKTAAQAKPGQAANKFAEFLTAQKPSGKPKNRA